MPKIKDVFVDAASCDRVTGEGMELTVYFVNNGSICVRLDSKLNAPLFDEVLSDNRCTEVKTDGERVLWPNGASLTIDEIINILREEERTQ